MCPRIKPRPQNKSSIKPAKLWILLIGVNQYQDQEHLASLQYSALDCQGLGEALTEATASFPHKEVIIHHDFASQSPELRAIEQSIERVLTAAEVDDTILFYFSGHGILDAATQQVVLCLTDTDTQNLLETGIPLNKLLTQLSNCAASQQLVWLDACHSGGMTLRGTAASDPSTQLVEVLRHKAAESKGFYALLSCDQTQQSWEFPELGHGVFTYYLMKGLQGAAADVQGIIEADALYQYVYHQTLRYIDKTNQQIRLINQQKSSRGESKLQQEFPLQTPKRIVEGFGKVILGKHSSPSLQSNPRQALIVDSGVASSTTLALSQILQNAGDFKLRYFPQTNEPWSKVHLAIAQSLNAQEQTEVEVETALLYLRGSIVMTSSGESVLELPDGVRLSRTWLCKTLQNARATQQIIILDCPGGHSLTEWVEDLQLTEGRGQCLIAASAPMDNCQQFAEAVLSTLQAADPYVELPIAAWINQLQIALAGSSIIPQVWLSGSQGVIELFPLKTGRPDLAPTSLDLGICPYVGLQAFNEATAEYFYGRDALVQKLINQVSHQSCVAVVGASGSGKSSAVQAGLMTKLRQGKQIPGSSDWWLGCFRPGNYPLQALANSLISQGAREAQAKAKLELEGLLYQGVDGFVRWLRMRPEPMVLLVIDQFEEIFTLAGPRERQEFLELILGALAYAGDRFKLVLTIRADFVAACLEVPELAPILQQNSILVPPYLAEGDYRQVMIKPAEQVGLQVESGLVEILLQDLDRSAGDLPLLQFALQQLWEQREQGKLTLKAYQKLEGIKGALERQAQSIYDSLDLQSQECARWIFLNLTQLGEGTEDTRRRITKSELMVAKYPQELVEATLRTLTDAKLLVVNLDDGTNLGQSRSASNPSEDDKLFLEALRQEATVEVVHEILIRHWSSLRWWLEENRARLRSQRQIEQAARLWLQQNKQDDFLLRGVRLAEAEEIYIKYTDELSDIAKEYVAACIAARLAEQKAAQQRLRKAQLTAALLGLLGLTATLFGVGAYRQKLMTQLENVDSLSSVAEAQFLSHQQLESLTTSVRAGKQLQKFNGLSKLLVGQDNWQVTQIKTEATLQQSLYGTQELNRLESNANQFARNVDSEQTLIIETPQHSFQVSGQEGATVELRAKSDNQLIHSYPHQAPINDISVSDDEALLATATFDGKINIWNNQGILQQSLSGHTGEVLDVKFLVNQASNNDHNQAQGQIYQLVSTGVDKTTRFWQVFNRFQAADTGGGIDSIALAPNGREFIATNWQGEIKSWQINSDGSHKLVRTIPGHQATVTQTKYSPDGTIIASASWDKTIKLWNAKTGSLITSLEGHQDAVNSIAFSPEGRILVSGSEDNTMKIWDLVEPTKPKLLATLQEHTDSIKTVIVSPNGQLIASGGYDNQIKIWNLSGELLQTWVGHDLAITSLAFTPDSQKLVSASWDNSVKIWILENESRAHHLQQKLSGHRDGVTTLSLNPNASVLATGSGDRTIKLWHTKTGNLIKTLRGHSSQINTLAFSLDGQSLISGEEQQGLFHWNLSLDDLLVRGCDRLADYLESNTLVKSADRNICQK